MSDRKPIEPSRLFDLIKRGDIQTLLTLPVDIKDIDTIDATGRSLMSWVVAQPQRQAIYDHLYCMAKDYFKQYGRNNLEYMDHKGRTLLHWAAITNQDARVLQELLQQGMDINSAKNAFKLTPLYIAARDGNLRAVDALINAGADVNYVCRNGATALFVACENGHLEAVKYLIAAGADVNAACNNGATPLSIAILRKHNAIAELLKAAGAH